MTSGEVALILVHSVRKGEKFKRTKRGFVMHDIREEVVLILVRSMRKGEKLIRAKRGCVMHDVRERGCIDVPAQLSS